MDDTRQIVARVEGYLGTGQVFPICGILESCCRRVMGAEERRTRPLGLVPATMTLTTSSLGPGDGMGTSWMVVWRVGVGWTITSFMSAWYLLLATTL